MTRPVLLASLVASWSEPPPALSRGEAVLYGLVHADDVLDVTTPAPPPLPHVDRVLHDLTRAGWGSPSRSLVKGLAAAGYGPVERAQALITERIKDRRLVMVQGGKWTWWSDAPQKGYRS